MIQAIISSRSLLLATWTKQLSINFKENKKELIENVDIVSDVTGEDLSRKSLSRVFAVDIEFRKVSFKQTEFVNCYFRNCRFIECDFTGSNFSDSYFSGSSYEGSQFKYSIWNNSHLDIEFLDNCLPSEENLARDLIRSLRVNFSQIGNYEAVNRAASREVELTGKHLYNAAYSTQAYYRSKYKGLSRFSHALQHLRWKTFDLLWGNGESLTKVMLSGGVILLFWSGFIASFNQELSLSKALSLVTQSFFDVSTTPALSEWHLAGLKAFQLIFVGLFLAIVIKRLSRR